MTPEEVINALGGPSSVAMLCDVSGSAVTQWKTNGIPNARWMYLKVIRKDLFKNVELKNPVREKAEA